MRRVADSLAQIPPWSAGLQILAMSLLIGSQLMRAPDTTGRVVIGIALVLLALNVASLVLSLRRRRARSRPDDDPDDSPPPR